MGIVLAAVIAASVVLSGVLLHVTWWRTATSVSRALVGTLERQIADAARRAWWTRVVEVQGLALTMAEGLAGADPAKQEQILATAMVTVPSLTWLVWLPADGDVVAIADAPGDRARVYHVTPEGAVLLMGDVGAGDMALAGRAGEPTDLVLEIADAPWTAQARMMPEPAWVDVPRTPDGAEPGVAWIVTQDDGLLAAIIGHGRFAELLGEIPVGRTGRSYVVGPDGRIVIAGHHRDAPRLPAMDAIALAAGTIVAARPAGAINVPEEVTLQVGGEGYAVSLSPLWFSGWQLAVIVPEAEFLGEIEDTILAVATGLIAFVLVAGAVAAFLAGRLVAAPITKVVGDLELVERFELERVPRRRSRLAEIDRLSEAIVRMSAGLADFGKFIPTDLVRALLAEGVRAEPSGTRRELTVLFADLAGFTSLSERLGDDVVPVVSSFLDTASRAIAANGGTVDKFIGDAVMAFWNAPAPDPDHARNAARAALEIVAAVKRLGNGLSVRVGVQTGPAIVGNVGAPSRLNYTALGDTVNQASRLEAVNKAYGTAVLLGAATRAALGPDIVVREIDAVVLYGRVEATRIYEPFDGALPGWASRYEDALCAYRDRRFADAVAILGDVARTNPDDGPTRRLAALCAALAADPPGADWEPVTNLAVK